MLFTDYQRCRRVSRRPKYVLVEGQDLRPSADQRCGGFGLSCGRLVDSRASDGVYCCRSGDVVVETFRCECKGKGTELEREAGLPDLFW